MKKLILAFICLLLAMPCGARTIYVDDDGPADFNNIQAAIDDSNNGDTIIVSPGTYTGLGNRDIDFLGKAITVRSENGPNNCIIDCENYHQGFYFHNNEDTDSILAGLTITNGYVTPTPEEGIDAGGGIACISSSPTISNCRIIDNTSAYSNGGGIYCYGSNPTITGCTITGNSAAYGSGIHCEESSPTIRNCTITDNSAELGGGIYCSESNSVITNCIISDNSGSGIYCRNSSPMITNCTITSNSAYREGGGIGCIGGSSPIIANCTITSNTTKDRGGGICCYGGHMTVANCIISDNKISGHVGDGGGMYISDSLCFIYNSIISRNTAVWNGGGLYGCSGPITNCIISNNSAEHSGGGLASCDGPITNCIITGNYSIGSGGGLYECKGPITNCTITNNSAIDSRSRGGGLCVCGPTTNCIIWNNLAADGLQLFRSTEPTYSCIQGWTSGGLGNITPAPCFIEPGYWADINDPNIIVEPNDPNAVWVDGDYHLLPDSLCIDAGDPNYIPGPNETDLDGNPRVNGGRIDMGAYESIMHEARLLLWPRLINRKSYWPKTITACLRLPQGITKDQVDEDTPLILYPGGIKAIRQFVIRKPGRCAKPTSIFAFFNKAELMDAIDTNGPVQLMVLGHLLDPGQYFYGSDTIRILAPRPPWP